MSQHAQGREVAARFDEKFGQRPDVLNNPADVYEFAKQGATSFHCSEELWKNPLLLKTEMTRADQDKIRIGWDLVIDVDCTVWEYSKLITHFIIQALRENGVSSISCKFSGNKGFHIGVPFEAFPKKVGEKETRLLFPDGVRIIASYLIDQVDRPEGVDRIGRFTKRIMVSGLDTLINKLGVHKEELLREVCIRCGTPRSSEKMRVVYICSRCEKSEHSEKEEVRVCVKCNKIMERKRGGKQVDYCPKSKCSKNRIFVDKLDIEKILSVDALLISSRHLYRMPYSLHEKSGLASIPIDPNKVLQFEKEMANPDGLVIPEFCFLDRGKIKSSDATMLFDRAFQWHLDSKTIMEEGKDQNTQSRKEFALTEAIPQDLFPPCIKLILAGIGDGKKRAVFILINFLRSVGYDYDNIEKMLIEWNAKNKEPIREVNWKGQLHYHKQQSKQALPPNCANSAYMIAIGVCKPDAFCQRIKNPAQYSKKKAWLLEQGTPKKKAVKPKAKEENPRQSGQIPKEVKTDSDEYKSQ